MPANMPAEQDRRPAFDPRRGKGSHGTFYLSTRFTVVKHGELSRGMLTAMLKDLGIARKDF